MKNLTEIIKKTSQKQLGEAAKLLDIKNSSGGAASAIQNCLFTFAGLSPIIDRLSDAERKVLHAAYYHKEGITYEDIGKKYELDFKVIEDAANKLSNKLLIYILKNRQKLTNKLDNIHLYHEIREILSPLEDGFLREYFEKIKSILESEDINKHRSAAKLIKKDANKNLIDIVFDSGGIAFFDDISHLFVKKNSQKILTDLARKKYIHISHDLILSGKTLIILDKKVFVAYVADTEEQVRKLNIHNGYNLLINVLKAYDTISTFGLFLTKQNVFRKIDGKRLESSMLNIVEFDGRHFNGGLLVQLVLYVFNVLNILKINNDAVSITLRDIRNLLENPFEWLLKILKYSGEPEHYSVLLEPPFKIPEFASVLSMIRLLFKNRRCSYATLETIFCAENISLLKDKEFPVLGEKRNRILSEFRNNVRYLCVTGVVDFENNDILLSDIGLKIASIYTAKDEEENTAGETDSKELKHNAHAGKNGKKSIYLNPDFTMMIPKKEILSEAMYHLLTHTEVIKDDIILNTIINRESILKSLKRGMGNDKFFSTLNQYLKNEIPGNLKFLINEWLNQTIKVNVFDATILRTDPSFIDKIAHSKVRSCIIKRISEEYVIVDRKLIDKVVKFAKENDAVINLFDEADM